MRLKEGVIITGLRSELLLGIIIARDVFDAFESDLVITSVVDGKHSTGSLHYSGAAVDLRIRDIPKDKLLPIVAELKRSLQGSFDVVLESDHIHIEFQPKE